MNYINTHSEPMSHVSHPSGVIHHDDVLERPEEYDFSVPALGGCSIESPIRGRHFVDDSDGLLFCYRRNRITESAAKGGPLPAYEIAGPRKMIYHAPAMSRAAIVTCGGLCPGLNDVIKGLVNTLYFSYGVNNIVGVRYGYRGLIPEFGHKPYHLTPDCVDKIHADGGTILGSSRGQQDTATLCDTLTRLNINMLFCIGGDGTLRCARDIAGELERREQKISVIGVPKTIDNDLGFIGRSFGFETAVYSTGDILTSAHLESRGVPNGIGLVKLMGRDSGFIAAYASLANSVVNFCLIPEDDFDIDGENGLLKALERRFASGKDHAVIVVAEGAGQRHFENFPGQCDASGNALKADIGALLKSRIKAHFTQKGLSCEVKYFDPSYAIRSIPAMGADAIFCYNLAENAAHAAMAGKTNMVVGSHGESFTHVPISLATMRRQTVDTAGQLWSSVLACTRQDLYFNPVSS